MAVSVKDYGATGDGVTNDRNAIQAALDAESHIFFPEGNYRVVGVHPDSPTFGSLLAKSGQVIEGPGRLVQSPGASILEAVGVEDVLVSNLGLVVDNPSPFASCFIAQQQSRNIRMIGCRMEATNVSAGVASDPSLTLHAFLGNSGSSELRVERCDVTGMQIKLSGSGAMRGLYAVKNVVRRPRNLGISAVQVAGGTLSDILFEDNAIIDPAGQGGLFVGSDSINNPVTELRRVTVRGNVVSGAWTGLNALGCLVRPGIVTEDLLVERNTLAGDGGTGTSQGIKFDPTVPSYTVRRMIIQNNDVRGFRTTGMAIHGGYMHDVLIRENYVEDGETGITIGRGNWYGLKFSRNVQRKSIGWGIMLGLFLDTDSFDQLDMVELMTNQASENRAEDFVLTQAYSRVLMRF